MSVKIGNITKLSGSAVTGLTISHITTSQNNRKLMVAVHGSDAAAGDCIATGVTYNGVALTKLNTTNRAGGGLQVCAEWWYLDNPSVGTFNAIITYTGTVTHAYGVVYELYNAMSGAPEASGLANATGVSTLGVSVTPISGYPLILLASTINTDVSITPTSPAVATYDDSINAASRAGGSKNEPATAGAITSTATTPSNTRWARVAAVITGIHEINVNDTPSAIIESVTVSRPPAFSVAESVINTTENLSVYLNALFFSIFETDITLNEVVAGNDSVVAVGVVDDDIVIASISVFLFLSELFSSEFDSASVVEDLSIHLGELYASVFDSAATSEDTILLLPDLYFDSMDIASLSESTEASLDILFVEVSDSSGITEALSLNLDVLNVDVLDPFYSTVTEHVEVTDIIVEVGIVMEAITEVNFAQLSLDVLNIIETEPIFNIDENIVIFIPVLNIDVNENIIIDETVLSEIPLEVIASENISTAEYSETTLDNLFVNESDSFSTVEQVSLISDILSCAVFDSIIIDEFISMHDLVIELEVFESAIVTDYSSAFLTALFMFSMDTITIAENTNSFLSGLSIFISDDVAIADVVIMNDLVIELFSFDSASVIDEFLIAIGHALFASDSITLSDFATIHDLIIELFAFDGVSALELFSTSGGVIIGIDEVGVTGALTDSVTVSEFSFADIVIQFQVSESISVIEYQVVFDRIIELGILFESVGLIDDFSILMPILNINELELFSVVEFVSGNSLIEISIMETFFIQDEALIFNSNHIDEPRIFEVVPRQRIFISLKESEYFASRFGVRGR